MNEALVLSLIKRDWEPFLEHAQRLGFGKPRRKGVRIDIPVRPRGGEEDFLAVLFCDDYDAQAPLLDFADPDDPTKVGAPYWPRIDGAPMNSVPWDGRTVPIVCTPGTRGYHIHSSHSGEQHPRSTWRLPVVAGLLGHFLYTMGTYGGKGV